MAARLLQSAALKGEDVFGIRKSPDNARNRKGRYVDDQHISRRSVRNEGNRSVGRKGKGVDSNPNIDTSDFIPCLAIESDENAFVSRDRVRRRLIGSLAQIGYRVPRAPLERAFPSKRR